MPVNMNQILPVTGPALGTLHGHCQAILGCHNRISSFQRTRGRAWGVG